MASQLYCNFLHLNKTVTPTFTDKPTELAHIEKQLHQLNHHISNLFELRSALLHRSNQLTSPVYIVPHEVLSYILNQAHEMKWLRPPPHNRQSIIPLQKAIVLSAVSRQWRQVAFGTSKLWENVECQGSRQLYKDSSMIIQHCATYATSLNISLYTQGHMLDAADDPDVIITALSTSDVRRKLKSLKNTCCELSPQWIQLLPSFLRLESLAIYGGNYPNIDLGSLPLSWVSLSGATFESLTLPPSVQVLNLKDHSARLSIALLYNCPRLIKFTSQPGPYSKAIIPSSPLVLDTLKKLMWSPAQSFVEAASATKLEIPVIERLELSDSDKLQCAPFTVLCHQISASLEHLTLKSFSLYNESSEFWQQFFKFPIPKLRKLSLVDWEHNVMTPAILALTPGEDEDGYRDRSLPNLEYLCINSLGFYDGPYSFDSKVLELVKRRRIGEDSPFHLDFSFSFQDYGGVQATWRPEIMQEFQEFLANRPVEITMAGWEVTLDQLTRLVQ
ncbi:hypothetical protein Agabi119p4_1390 [Agaricus bisporus var. burnettii]|uniref:F-box domain-containing protein n=1 Tax=Agaricus bisporus var. burnettii TaxID=192524 RepID=A0A8H7FDJ9_AGABI|nr:hypothetical protein Agabi119p4_1390 [Agaricus bisporus var. burnettii]